MCCIRSGRRTSMPAAELEVDGEPDFSAFRIADFLICSRHFRSFDIGVFQSMTGEQSGLVRVEGEFDKETGRQSFSGDGVLAEVK